MTRYVIDPVALVELCRDGRDVDPEHSLVAPNALRSQALELLLAEVAAGRIEERAALELHERMTAVKIRLLGDRVSRRTAWNLAREHGWPTLRDAEYLAVTRLQADALIAGDNALAERARGMVELAELSDVLVR